MIRTEMILMILAGIILGTIILGENSVNETTSQTLVTSQEGISAASIANSYIDKASSAALAFDQYTISNSVSPTQADSISQLAHLSTPGRDAGETSQSQFNDVDDYNGLDTVVNVADVGNFHVRCDVHYYDPSTDKITSAKTWFKKFTVTVTDTIPGSTNHQFQFNGQKAEIQKSLILSYYNFLM